MDHDSELPDPIAGPADADGPTPEARAIGMPAGVPAVLGDGRTWLIARCGLARGMAPIRDALYESMTLRGQVKAGDVLGAAWYGLSVNYDLTDEELRAILEATPVESIVDEACEAAIPATAGPRSFTAWARSALVANGIAPGDVDPDDLPHVLDQLVGTKRAMPLDAFTDAGRAAAEIGGVRRMAERAIAERRAKLATE